MKRPHAEDKPVTSRVVTRYYFNGKGYPTKQLAYRAKAKRLLVELVLGPWEEQEEYIGPHLVNTFWNLSNAPAWDGTEDKKRLNDERFAKFFPHDECEGMTQPGCLHAQSASMCRQEYEYDGEDGGEFGDFDFKSCKWSQEQWIKAKVRELIAADSERNT